MKLATILLLVTLVLIGKGQANCNECEQFLEELGQIILNEENVEYQIEYLVELFCVDESIPDCADLFEEGWPFLLETFVQMENVGANLCSLMGADENCQIWETSTTDVDNCVERVDDFAALTEIDVFEEFTDFLASEYCRFFCQDSDDDDCFQQCIGPEEEGVPVGLKALIKELQKAAQGFCGEITSTFKK